MISGFERWLTVFDEDAAVVCLIAMIFLSAPVALTQNPFLLFLFMMLFMYIALTYVRAWWYRKVSKQIGLQYYYLIPSNLMFGLAGRKLRIPKEMSGNIWRIHVNRRSIRGRDGRAALRLRRADIRLLAQIGSGSKMVVVGSTYADIGRLNLPQQKIKIIEYPFPLVFFQEWLFTKRNFYKDQEQMFGKVYYPIRGRMKWKTFVFIFE